MEKQTYTNFSGTQEEKNEIHTFMHYFCFVKAALINRS